MKISRLEAITILLCAVCLSFTAGWFLRGDVSAQPVRVETQRTLSEEEAVVILPSPSAEPAPTASDVPAETTPAETAPAESVSSPQPSASAAQQTEKININTADARGAGRFAGQKAPRSLKGRSCIELGKGG